MESERREKVIWWLFASAIAALCLILGILQYNWISEVSIAERERMQASLRSSLQRLSRDFNGELSATLLALRPDGPPGDESKREAEYSKIYERWKESSPHRQLLKRMALAIPHGSDTDMLMLDPASEGSFQVAAWPPEWTPIREQLAARLSGDGFGGRPPLLASESMVIVLPRFRAPLEPARRPVASEWLLIEFNAGYIRTAILPELLRRHLGATDYEAAVAWSQNPGKFIFQSDPKFTGNPADATVRLFDVQFEMLFRRRPPRFFGRDRAGFDPRVEKGGMSPGPPPDRGEWTLSVRHRAGSLEAVVQRGRWRNMAILAGLLLLMLAALGALIRFTARERRLAKLQMDFVAGISHELRTPLSVIRTAAHNLHGGLVSNPKQIQRYGALIRDESERLTSIVEQVLRFAGAQAGRVIQAREPIRVESLVDEALAATARITDEAGCLVERDLAPDLPLVSADPVALKHALINLVANAAKYGFSGGWIGVRARLVDGEIEIAVQDRGQGIAPIDQAHIFDAFYRGKKAVEDQTHGTGLGLNLVKRIAEAHDGTVTVKSEPGVGTEFTLRIPPAPARRPEEDEFAHTIDRG